MNNPRRLIRFIEKKGEIGRRNKPFTFKIYSLKFDWDSIKDTINKRVDRMIKDGLIDENKLLLEKGFNYDLKSMNSIGYKEFKDYFENKKTKEDCINDLKLNTLHLAKKQKTWLKSNKDIIWIKDLKDLLSDKSLHYLEQ